MNGIDIVMLTAIILTARLGMRLMVKFVELEEKDKEEDEFV